MSTLVFLEHHGGELLKGSLGVLAKAATLGDAVMRLTPSQTKALNDELYAVLRRFRTDAPPSEAGETTELVVAHLQVFPVDLLEDRAR